jgi:hypothetical protein
MTTGHPAKELSALQDSVDCMLHPIKSNDRTSRLLTHCMLLKTAEHPPDTAKWRGRINQKKYTIDMIF